MSQQHTPPGRPPSRGRPGNWTAPAIIIAVIAVAAVLAVAMRPGEKTPSPVTATFSVTGDPADVTWGPAGSSFQGAVPMSVTVPLGDAAFYALDAQLTGDGTVTCRISSGGAVLSQSAATGTGRLALCEISRDPLTGQWRGTTGG